jgi:hypothetical protein
MCSFGKCVEPPPDLDSVDPIKVKDSCGAAGGTGAAGWLLAVLALLLGAALSRPAAAEPAAGEEPEPCPTLDCPPPEPSSGCGVTAARPRARPPGRR